MATEEMPFPDDGDDTALDGSDVPLDVVRSLVTTGVCDAGFLLDGAGGIVRTGAAEILEDVDEEGDLPAALDKQLGRGHRAKTGSTRYGAEWEEH